MKGLTLKAGTYKPLNTPESRRKVAAIEAKMRAECERDLAKMDAERRKAFWQTMALRAQRY